MASENVTAGNPPPSVKRSGRWVYLVAGVIFLGYTSWILGPYIRSVIVRDAAVTTWLHTATSPIDGAVTLEPLAVGGTVGADGIIAVLRNDRVSQHELVETEIRADLAAARVTWLKEFIANIKLYDRGRAGLKAGYADNFRAELDSEIAGLEREIKAIREQLALMRKIADSRSKLVEKGWAAQLVADEETIRVSELELRLVELRAKLDSATRRRLAADTGVFMSEDGSDPPWVRASRIELKLQKEHAHMELKEASAELELARAARRKAEEDFQKLSQGAVLAPKGSVVWSLRVAPGAAVRAGEPVAHWLNCSILLIDVPVSDAEVSLIKPEMPADVVLEGETKTRPARVVLTRGSASTLGTADLAARAKGRHEGVAQVLLELTETRDQIEGCPVGRAAFVDFPDVGLWDVVRARLRF